MALTLVVTADPPVIAAGGSSIITVEVQGAAQPVDYLVTLHAAQGALSADGEITIHQDAPPVTVDGTAAEGTLTKNADGTFTFDAPA